MGKLQGKIAVITGGTQGIGLVTAKLFASEGAYVFITGRRRKELEEAVASIGNNVTGVQGDVANLADLDRLYESVEAKGRMSSSPMSDWADSYHWEASPKSTSTRPSTRTSRGCFSQFRKRFRF